MTVEKVFTQDDQLWFAAHSGDCNPLHMDAQWANRHFPGAQVVHGMHILLWALDKLCHANPMHLNKIQATWVQPVVLGDRLRLECNLESKVLRAFLEHEPVMVARLGIGDLPASGKPFKAADGTLTAPILWDSETIANGHGTVVLPTDAIFLPERFPHLSQSIGPQALAGLAGISTLIGMHCPGLHSMLSELNVTFSITAQQSILEYAVTRWVRQFSSVEISARGLGLEARVQAFAGKSEEVTTHGLVREAVSEEEFLGSTPLIIGASAGLGSITARLLAAGGARPMLTWHGSRDDLRETRSAIAALAGRSDDVFFDILFPQKSFDALRNAGWKGEQIYFFATPRIFRRRIELYSRTDLTNFWQIYVDGFYELVTHLMARNADRAFHIFYPSSVSVTENTSELLEYVMAKHAGERLCQRLQQKYKRLKIVAVRLPRIHTRQTQTFVKVPARTPLEVMLPIVRQVQNGD